MKRLNQALSSRATKPVIWLLCLLPLAWLFWGAIDDQLGANPAEALLRSTGDWALRGLCITLAVTPLRQGLGLTALARVRRLLGLFAFFYVVLHFICYAWLDMGWDGNEILSDIAQRPFILVGMLTALILLALAATSPQAVLRAMGGKRWKRLHWSIHIAAWLALLHFFWMRAGKNNFAEVWVYAAIIGVLQLWRLWRFLRSRRTQ